MTAGRENPLQIVLHEIRDKVRAKILPIVIFDLDDTLLFTQVRNLRIIHEFAADHAREFPDFAKVAAQLIPSDLGWEPSSALINKGLSERSPSLPVYKAYWDIVFFTDSYAALDLPVPGAKAFVQACHKAGALIYYLSGRQIARQDITITGTTDGWKVTDHVSNGMELGTAQALTRRGFPFWAGRCEIFLKKDVAQADADFKKEALAQVASLQGQVVATFDNEPANVEVFVKELPTARNIWVRTTWNPLDTQSTDEFVWIPSFDMALA